MCDCERNEIRRLDFVFSRIILFHNIHDGIDFIQRLQTCHGVHEAVQPYKPLVVDEPAIPVT